MAKAKSAKAKMTAREAVIAALVKEFEGCYGDTPKQLRAMVERSVYTGKSDPGGWAPRAEFVIHTENGLPPGDWIEEWGRAGDEVSKLGFPLFFEAVNGGVVAVYRV